MGPDVHVFKDQDFTISKYTSVQFSEEMNYIGLPGKEKVGVVFEVKAYDPRDSRLEEVVHLGWAFLPLFVTCENENQTFSLFVNSGLMQVSCSMIDRMVFRFQSTKERSTRRS